MPAHRAKAVKAGESPVGFLDVLRIRVFAILYAAEIQSIVGDQLARVALSVLIFEWTGSAWATAVTYGLTFLPAVLGGFALARITYYLPRRAAMIGCELVRAAAFAAMAIPGIPAIAVGALLVVAVFVGPAFTASAVSYLSVRLAPAQFRTALGLRSASNQIAQVAGFAVGGVLVGAIGAQNSLLLDAATYLVSGMAVLVGVRAVASTSESESPADAAQDDGIGALAVLRLAARTPAARTMLMLSMLAGFFVVPESLAVPFAAQIHATTTQAGLLLASIPLGGAVGVLLLVRFVSGRVRHRAAILMAMVTGVPLIFTAVFDQLPVALACWFVSGAAASYQLEAFVTLVGAVPDAMRSQLLSVFGSLLLTTQGVGPLVFGLVASSLSPALAIGIAGSVGAAMAVALASGSLRSGGRLAPGAGRARVASDHGLELVAPSCEVRRPGSE